MRAHNASVPIHPVPGSLDSRLIIGAIHAQHALNAANDPTDRSADNGADRTSTTISFIRAVGKAAWYALRLCCHRQCDKCNECGRNQNLELHEVVLPVF
jgi:hypothetical protein